MMIVEKNPLICLFKGLKSLLPGKNSQTKIGKIFLSEMEKFLSSLSNLESNKNPIIFNKSWSSKLFLEHNVKHPVEENLIVQELNNKDMLYLDFFEKTRGFKLNLNYNQERLFDIFSKGSIMMYFEEMFLTMLNLDTLDDKLLNVFRDLSEIYPYQWDSYVSQYGASSIKTFMSSPEVYMNGCIHDKEILKSISYSIGFSGNDTLRLLTPNITRGKLEEIQNAEVLSLFQE